MTCFFLLSALTPVRTAADRTRYRRSRRRSRPVDRASPGAPEALRPTASKPHPHAAKPSNGERSGSQLVSRRRLRIPVRCGRISDIARQRLIICRPIGKCRIKIRFHPAAVLRRTSLPAQEAVRDARFKAHLTPIPGSTARENIISERNGQPSRLAWMRRQDMRT